LVQQHCRRNDVMLERVQAAIGLAHAHELGTFVQLSMGLQGWAMAQGGKLADGMVQLRASIEQARASGARYVEGYNLVLLAELAGNVGDVAQGLQLCDEVLALVAETGAHWCEAEACRRKGELLLRAQDTAAGDTAEAETALRQALALAQGQAAKSLELRAAVSLARLWHRTDRGDEASRLLAPIYGWFTEGLATPDLQDARELLEALLRDG
jgi:predicted ATPase